MPRLSAGPLLAVATSVLLAACVGQSSPPADGVDSSAAAPPTEQLASDAPGAAADEPGATDATSPDSVTLMFSRGEEPASVRRAAGGTADIHEALALLVRGPTQDEEAAGIHSWFSEETAGVLRSVDVDGSGHAVVDFEGLDALIPNASSSAGSRLLLMQLNGTAFQFPAIRTVEYRLSGSCAAFGEWLQTGCVMHERTRN